MTNGALVHVSVVIVFLDSLQRLQYVEMIHERIHSKDRRTDGGPREQRTNFISSILLTLTWTPFISPRNSSRLTVLPTPAQHSHFGTK